MTLQEHYDSTPTSPVPQKEDQKNFYQKLVSSFSDVAKNPTTRLITAAGVMRHFSDAIIASFLPVFFLRTYPAFKT